MLLPKQAISFGQLLKEKLSEKKIFSMTASLKLFPTPFKGIYYVPLEEERKGAFIDKPEVVLYRAIGIFLDDRNFYFSCSTAEEALGISWHPSGIIHIVNSKLSRDINLENRIARNKDRHTWRAQRSAKLLSFYGKELIFHKVNNISSAKTYTTPYGRFATRSQIKKDERRFREI